LTFDPKDVKTYEVDFLNECQENGEPCKFKPKDPEETKRNDFHFMRKILKLKPKRTRYGLHISAAAGIEPHGPPCNSFSKLTDEAPRMGTGFGQTSGFP